MAEELGDTPETVISVHMLTRGLCKVYAKGDIADDGVAIVQGDCLPGEPTGFGSDPVALWEVLQLLEGWDCVEVEPGAAEELGDLIHSHRGCGIRSYEDVYYALDSPVRCFTNEAVRLLALGDLPLLRAAPKDVQGAGFEDTAAMLSEGIVAGAIVSGQLVAIAHTSAITDGHGDIGVCTLEPYRRRGYSTAAASLVAQGLQETGRTPVWSTGCDNHASRRVAEKLGYQQVASRTYVIVK